jgi:exopolyphosphatase / guanosine-5'-triphosphate,3'-diphosphate pyrophosphatase
MTAGPAAAIDLGSNATRLLVRRDGRPPLRRSRLTHLAEDLAATGELGPGGLERTAAALRDYRALVEQEGVPLVGVVATAAARSATNTDALAAVVADVLDAPLRVLSADEEARLTFAGVRDAGATPAGLRLVVDIGGGSTELVVGDTEPAGAASLDLGSASLTGDQLPSDPPKPEELSNAIAIVQEHVDDALRHLPELDELVPVVGTGGTITTVAAVEIGLPVGQGDGSEDLVDESLHGFWLARAATEDVFRTLAGEALRDRVHNPGLARDRATVIVGGCCILVGLLRKLGSPGLRVSLADLLDGVLTSAG